MKQPDLEQGLVIAAHGRHYVVELDDGSLRTCFPRGKRSEVAVGDRVMIAPAGAEEGTIQKILERSNLLYRADDNRSKLFAANIDQLFIVVATEPAFSEDLVGRALVAARHAGITPVIILNKTDLVRHLDASRQRLAWLSALEIPIIELNATDADETRQRLTPWLEQRTTLLLGQSAMGKSTILNALVPWARAQTQEHSQALGAGRHTTTTTRLYALPSGKGAIIDSPGFQSFGLHHLDATDIAHGFPEFRTDDFACRFHNCSHRHEPGCQVLERLEKGEIAARRHQLYTRLMDEHEARTPY